MFSKIWPIGLVVLSNIVYHICAKSVPDKIDPLASLTATYLVGAVASAVLYFILNRGGNLFHEYAGLNWSPFVLGIVIVGLEVGNIYAYKSGWSISTESIVQNAFLAVALILVGYIIYHEKLTGSKIAGILICVVGLYFVNK